MVGGVFEMSSERLWDEFLDLQESHKELTERLRVACETIEQLKRVNQEWEALWKPIDELVRPLTPLGESVGDMTVYLLKGGIKPKPRTSIPSSRVTTNV